MYGTDTRKDAESVSRLREVFESIVTRNTNFTGNISAERGYRRAERLVAALHLVTAPWASDEPLRKTIRSESEELLVVFLAGDSRAIRAHARALISFVRVAATAGLVSTSNASILTEVLDDILSVISVGAADEHILTRDELIPHVQERPATKQRLSRTLHVTDTGTAAEDTPAPGVLAHPLAPRITHALTARVRTQGILEALRRDESLGIRDIHARLPEYSEKMIQRGLLTLVLEGTVRKTGEKRWSRYTLI